LTTGINDTGGKIVASINDTSGKFATGINDTGSKFCHQFHYTVVDTGGKLPPVSTILAANLPPMSLHRRQLATGTTTPA
jgi:hypothetical protein